MRDAASATDRNNTVKSSCDRFSVTPQSVQGFFDQLSSQFLFFIGRNISVPHHMNDAVAEHQSVRANHFRHRQR